jgi:raffinose/stachyose/melibiose transport system permease protein
MKQKVMTIIRVLFYCICFIIVIFPLLFILVSTFKNESQLFTNPWGLPTRIDFTHYISLFRDYDMLIYYKNSLYFSFFSGLISVAVTSTAAYGIARMKWKLNKPVFAYLMSGLMIPVHALVVPLYISVSALSIPKTLALLFIYVAVSIPTSMFLIIGYLQSTPSSIEESAVIDGCSIPVLFVRIIIPIIKPVLATTIIFNFLTVWKELMLALIFLNKEHEKTIQLGIIRFTGVYYSNYPLLLAAIVLAIIPSTIIYLLMSERIISGITAGAVKG